ncbi:Conserved_hypothetical protein [Hexamita inflata]|uniref:Uncharacterized protein n=1 Tax=Hexamita inflata TaxID=28002 RepID=A0AA86PY07_9EUKA|nr:Conserved hypothetical protein [Hexamita inflata]CAI9947348.1 Conserved hypothetical protein [Hexamita inflata]
MQENQQKSRPTSRSTTGHRSRPGTGQAKKSRPQSSVSHFNLNFTTDMIEFQKAVDDLAPPESQFLSLNDKLTQEDVQCGVSDYLQRCAQLDLQPRSIIINQLRTFQNGLELQNLSVGPKGVLALEPALKKNAAQLKNLNLNNAQLGTEGFIALTEVITGQKISAEEEGIPMCQNLTTLNVSGNNIQSVKDMTLNSDAILPLLPRDQLEFAQQIKLKCIQAENAPKKKKEEKKNDKEEEFQPRSTVLLGLNSTQPRPYEPPKKADKGGSKAPEIPPPQFLEAHLGFKSKLDSLNLKPHCITGVCAFKILSSCRLLTTLDISHNFLGDDSVQIMCAALPQASSLQILNLSGNNLSDRCIVQLLNQLQSSTVHTLNLSNNLFSQNGAAVIGNFLATKNQYVQNINLSKNPFGDIGSAFILTALTTGQIINGAAKKVVEEKKEEKKAVKAPTKLLIKDVVRPPQNKFDHIEKYIQAEWQTALALQIDKCDWTTKVPDSGANEFVSIQLQNTGIQTIAACQLVKLLKNVKAIGRLDISNNQPSELAFYQIMKALKERGNGFSQEQITLDWVEVDEDDIREKVESYEEYSKIVEGISNLGKAIVFAK